MSRKSLAPVASAADLAAAQFNPNMVPSKFDLNAIYGQTKKALEIASERVREARVLSATQERQTRAEGAPPASNTGGNYREVRLVTENGSAFEVPARRGWGGDSAMVDWCNFTCHDSSFFLPSAVNPDGETVVCDEDLIRDVSATLMEIFGFGITEKRQGGMNFYQRSYVLGDKWGFVCHGGQRDTLLVQLSGSGCAAAKEGWELRLQTFLEERATNGRITRLDLAHDDYDGLHFSADGLEKAFDEGQFKMSLGGRNPNIELRGNWKNPNGKGRTIYVGSRENGKLFRGYEKGKQLGDATSEWFRCEVEFRAESRIIPFDALTRAGEYLAAAYPVLSRISERQERILTQKKTTEITYERTKVWLHDQCGAAINVMMEMETDASAVIAMIRKEGAIPKRLVVPDYRSGGDYIHERKPEALPLEAYIDWSFNLANERD